MVGVHGIRFMLLVFALVGFAGAGAAFAVARHRLMTEGDRDIGLGAISLMFLAFGALCTLAASGVFGVLVFGGVTVSASYLLTARRLGLLEIEVHSSPSAEQETTQHHGT